LVEQIANEVLSDLKSSGYFNDEFRSNRCGNAIHNNIAKCLVNTLTVYNAKQHS